MIGSERAIKRDKNDYRQERMMKKSNEEDDNDEEEEEKENLNERRK